MASGDAFHRAYTHATQQALLEAHELAFAYFGGVFRTLRYDFVPGYKIVILLPAALCGLGPAELPLSRRTS
jgi:transposase